MSAEQVHPRRVDLERLSAEELTSEERHHINLHLEGCTACREYVEELAAEQRLLLAQQPAIAFADRILESTTHRAFPWRLPLPWIGAAGVAAAAVALLVLWSPGQGPLPAEEQWQLRGRAMARAVLRRDGRVRDLDPTEPLQVGDSLRLEVTSASPEPVFAALIALPGESRAPFALSPQGLAAFPVQGQAILPGSVEVSADPEPVRLLLLVRERAFDLADVIREVEAHEGATHPMNFDVTEVRGVIWTRVVSPGAP